MSNFAEQFNNTIRTVRAGHLQGQEATTVKLVTELHAPIDQVWTAVSEASSISTWFVPVTGELQRGGSYELEGNASGQILDCDAQRSFRISWVMGRGPYSEMELKVTPVGPSLTMLEIDHIAVVDPQMMETYGPGSVGVGWDLTLLSLKQFLQGVPSGLGHAPSPAESAPLITSSSESWAKAWSVLGVDPEKAAQAAANTTALYTGVQNDAGNS